MEAGTGILPVLLIIMSSLLSLSSLHSTVILSAEMSHHRRMCRFDAERGLEGTGRLCTFIAGGDEAVLKTVHLQIQRTSGRCSF